MRFACPGAQVTAEHVIDVRHAAGVGQLIAWQRQAI